ncbi:MAG: hypothetical protein V4736_10845, partial [Bdellovibrionota bacterium]
STTTPPTSTNPALLPPGSATNELVNTDAATVGFDPKKQLHIAVGPALAAGASTTYRSSMTCASTDSLKDLSTPVMGRLEDKNADEIINRITLLSNSSVLYNTLGAAVAGSPEVFKIGGFGCELSEETKDITTITELQKELEEIEVISLDEKKPTAEVLAQLETSENSKAILFRVGCYTDSLKKANDALKRTVYLKLSPGSQILLQTSVKAQRAALDSQAACDEACKSQELKKGVLVQCAVEKKSSTETSEVPAVERAAPAKEEPQAAVKAPAPTVVAAAPKAPVVTPKVTAPKAVVTPKAEVRQPTSAAVNDCPDRSPACAAADLMN